MEALREEKRLRFCPWMYTQQEGRELQVPERLATHEEEEKCLHETKIAQPMREEPTDPKIVVRLN